MPLQNIDFRPGVIRENPPHADEGAWWDSDKVRFRRGYPESIGGWAKYTTNTYTGVCRFLYNWVTLDGLNCLGIGTHKKFYREFNGALTDVTPLRKTTNPMGNNPFTTGTAGSKIVTVTDTSHGALVGDYVTFSGVSGPIDGIPAGDFNTEHQVLSIPTANTYTIQTATGCTAGSVSGGGAACVAEYQINIGNDVASPIEGYGAGGYSSGVWGTSSITLIRDAIRLWSGYTFGEDLVTCARGLDVYYLDVSVAPLPRLKKLSELGGAADTPGTTKYVFVTEQRFVVALGTTPIGSSTSDPLLVRWSNQENAVDWSQSAVNTAGDYRLALGTQIMCGFPIRGTNLIFTDTAVYSMQYVGPPNTFGFELLADQSFLVGPNAAVVVGNLAFWMGNGRFYVYDGQVQSLACDLRRYIFDDFNYDQIYQVFAFTNLQYGEISWLYCSANSSTIDRYVTFNFEDKVWYKGTIARTAWTDTYTRSYPIAAGYDSYLYAHEFGLDDGSTSPATAVNSYIESYDVNIGQVGEQFQFVRRVLPDITFEGSDIYSPSITMTLKTRDYGGGTYNVNSTSGGTITKAGDSPEQWTKQIHTRLRGRQLSVRLENTTVGVRWRSGRFRVDIRPDGRKS